jgi:flagellar P-ring protein precursor FlgI
MKGNRTGLVMMGMVLSVLMAGVVYGQTVRERVVGPTARVKDIATVKGVRDNQLFGYGLVVGLNGTGDGRRFTPAVQALSNMLRRMNVTVKGTDLRQKNVAAVMVTARLLAFKEEGSKIDVVVSSVGDATSLAGGTLIQTPLQGPDGSVYAAAQGPISVGAENPASGRVKRGANVERELPDDFVRGQNVTFVLERADFTTAALVAETINQEVQTEIAYAKNGSTIVVQIPAIYQERPVSFISRLEQLPVVYPSSEARVVIDEKTWTVVINGDVRILPVVISHGDISLNVPGVVVPDRLFEVNAEGTLLSEVVQGLKQLKASPQDLAQIVMAIERAGALQAKLEIVE